MRTTGCHGTYIIEKEDLPTGQKTKVGDTFHLDDRASGDGSGQLEATVAQKLNQEDRARKAIFGYARLDVIKHKDDFQFGQWNDRPLEKAHVKRLVQSFLTQGADRFSFMKAIPLVVTPGHFKKGTYAEKYVPGTVATPDLPILELESGENGKKRLVAAGGQHRVNAVEEWVKTLRKQHNELARQRDMLEKQDSEMATSVDIEQENFVRKPKRDALKETLALGGQWMVILYNKGQQSHTIDRRLAHLLTPLKCAKRATTHVRAFHARRYMK